MVRKFTKCGQHSYLDAPYTEEELTPLSQAGLHRLEHYKDIGALTAS